MPEKLDAVGIKTPASAAFENPVTVLSTFRTLFCD
jgi:hypothetical protein